MASFFIVLIMLSVLGVAKAKETLTPKTRVLTKEELEEDLQYMIGRSQAENRRYLKNKSRR